MRRDSKGFIRSGYSIVIPALNSSMPVTGGEPAQLHIGLVVRAAPVFAARMGSCLSGSPASRARGERLNTEVSRVSYDYRALIVYGYPLRVVESSIGEAAQAPFDHEYAIGFEFLNAVVTGIGNVYV